MGVNLRSAQYRSFLSRVGGGGSGGGNPQSRKMPPPRLECQEGGQGWVSGE